MRKSIYLFMVIVCFLGMLFSTVPAALAHPPAQEPTPPPGPEPPEEPPWWAGFLPDLPTDAPPPWEILGEWALAKQNDLMIRFWRFIARIFWWLEKLSANLVNGVVETAWWDLIWTLLLETLKHSVASGPLRAIIFGAGGLFYVAICVAAISMMVPEVSLVRADKAIIWACIILALFVSGGSGFDLIGAIEEWRMEAATGILEAGDTDGLAALIAVPMQADVPAEIEDLALELPVAFAAAFYPEPAESDFEEKEMVFSLGLVAFAVPVKIETQESQVSRLEKAVDGMTLAFLTLVPAGVIALFGTTFVLLSVGALILATFFVAGLPLGFFDFGAEILMGIVRQYVYIFALTLLAGVLATTLVGVCLGAFPSGNITLAGAIAYTPTLAIVGFAMAQVCKMSLSATTGSLGVMQRGISAVTSMAYVGDQRSRGQQTALGSLGVAGLTMGIAAMTGGLGAGLAAGLGAMSGAGTSSSTRAVGRAAGRLITATSRGRGAATFAAAARGYRSLDKMTGVIATQLRYSRRGRRGGARDEGRFEVGVQRQSRRLDPRWGAVNAGSFLTTDLSVLSRAEEAYFERKDQRTARRELERAFGSGDVAESVVGVYERGGKRAARLVRRAVEASQATAVQMDSEGHRLFDDQGQATRRYSREVRAALERGGVPIQENPRWWGELVGSTVRRPLGVWADEHAPEKLAQATLAPEQPAQVAVGDTSALLRLNEMAVRHEWGPGELQAIYEAVRQAVAGTDLNQPVAEEVQRALGELSFMPRQAEEVAEVARLASLVTGDAQSQQSLSIDVAPQAAPMAASTFQPGRYQEAMQAYHSGNGENARALMVQAVGSERAADAILDALQRYRPEDAAQLPEFMETAAELQPDFESSGVPTMDFKEAVTTGTPGTTPDAAGFFFQVADDLLYRVDERLVERVDEMATMILQRGQAAGGAQANLNAMAQQHGWSQEDLEMVLTEAIMGGSPGAGGTALPPFADAHEDEVMTTLAVTRDAIRQMGLES